MSHSFFLVVCNHKLGVLTICHKIPRRTSTWYEFPKRLKLFYMFAWYKCQISIWKSMISTHFPNKVRLTFRLRSLKFVFFENPSMHRPCHFYYWICHFKHKPSTLWSKSINLKMACTWRTMAIFCRSVNPIPNKGGRFYPPFTTGTPKCFTFRYDCRAIGRSENPGVPVSMYIRSGKMIFFCFQIQNAWHQTFLLT